MYWLVPMLGIRAGGTALPDKLCASIKVYFDVNKRMYDSDAPTGTWTATANRQCSPLVMPSSSGKGMARESALFTF